MKETNIAIASIIREEAPKSGNAYDLVAGIKQFGILERVILQETTSGKYAVIDGRRRIDAAELVGLSKVPARVYDVDDLETEAFNVVLLLLQMHRSPNPGREFKALKTMTAQGLSLDEIADKLYVNKSKLKKIYKLAGLHERWLGLLCGGHVTMSKAMSLARLKKETQQYLLSEHGSNIKPEVISEAIREQTAGPVSQSFGGEFDILPTKSPMQVLFEDFAESISVSKNCGLKERTAINVLREFVAANFALKGGAAAGSAQGQGVSNKDGNAILVAA